MVIDHGENLSNLIDDSIDIIKISSDVGPETSGKLIEYLHDIKAELVSKTPKWRKIIGALVILSTILCGVAAAPQAIENVNKAINEILGTSIEKAYPNQLPSIENHSSQIKRI